MDWLQFEQEIRDLVAAFGYEAEATKPTGDFGVDVIARNQRRTLVVQCKLYGKGKIGGDTMMKLVGSRTYFKASDAICITTSQFTKQALEIAKNEDIKLVDRDKLVLLCREKNLTIPSLTVLLTSENVALPLHPTETLIGRAEGNHIVVPSPEASRRHALLHRAKMVLTVQDCGSANGTGLNGKRLAGPVPVNYGDALNIGGVTLVVAMQTPTGVVTPKRG